MYCVAHLRHLISAIIASLTHHLLASQLHQAPTGFASLESLIQGTSPDYFHLICYNRLNIANIARNNHLFYFSLILKLIHLTNAISVVGCSPMQ